MHFKTLSIVLAVTVVALLACSISATDDSVQANNAQIQSKHNQTDVDHKGSDRKLNTDADTEHDEGVTFDDEERAIPRAFSKLGALFRKTGDLTKVKNAFQNKAPITVIRPADISKMEKILSRNPSLMKTLDKIPLKTARTNFILNINMTKLMYLLVMIGVVATGAVMVGGLVYALGQTGSGYKDYP